MSDDSDIAIHGSSSSYSEFLTPLPPLQPLSQEISHSGFIHLQSAKNPNVWTERFALICPRENNLYILRDVPPFWASILATNPKNVPKYVTQLGRNYHSYLPCLPLNELNRNDGFVMYKLNIGLLSIAGSFSPVAPCDLWTVQLAESNSNLHQLNLIRIQLMKNLDEILQHAKCLETRNTENNFAETYATDVDSPSNNKLKVFTFPTNINNEESALSLPCPVHISQDIFHENQNNTKSPPISFIHNLPQKLASESIPAAVDLLTPPATPPQRAEFSDDDVEKETSPPRSQAGFSAIFHKKSQVRDTRSIANDPSSANISLGQRIGSICGVLDINSGCLTANDDLNQDLASSADMEHHAQKNRQVKGAETSIGVRTRPHTANNVNNLSLEQALADVVAANSSENFALPSSSTRDSTRRMIPPVTHATGDGHASPASFLDSVEQVVNSPFLKAEALKIVNKIRKIEEDIASEFQNFNNNNNNNSHSNSDRTASIFQLSEVHQSTASPLSTAVRTLSLGFTSRVVADEWSDVLRCLIERFWMPLPSLPSLPPSLSSPSTLLPSLNFLLAGPSLMHDSVSPPSWPEDLPLPPMNILYAINDIIAVNHRHGREDNGRTMISPNGSSYLPTPVVPVGGAGDTTGLASSQHSAPSPPRWIAVGSNSFGQVFRSSQESALWKHSAISDCPQDLVVASAIYFPTLLLEIQKSTSANLAANSAQSEHDSTPSLGDYSPYFPPFPMFNLVSNQIGSNIRSDVVELIDIRPNSLDMIELNAVCRLKKQIHQQHVKSSAPSPNKQKSMFNTGNVPLPACESVSRLPPSTRRPRLQRCAWVDDDGTAWILMTPVASPVMPAFDWWLCCVETLDRSAEVTLPVSLLASEQVRAHSDANAGFAFVRKAATSSEDDGGRAAGSSLVTTYVFSSSPTTASRFKTSSLKKEQKQHEKAHKEELLSSLQESLSSYLGPNSISVEDGEPSQFSSSLGILRDLFPFLFTSKNGKHYKALNKLLQKHSHHQQLSLTENQNLHLSSDATPRELQWMSHLTRYFLESSQHQNLKRFFPPSPPPPPTFFASRSTSSHLSMASTELVASWRRTLLELELRIRRDILSIGGAAPEQQFQQQQHQALATTSEASNASIRLSSLIDSRTNRDTLVWEQFLLNVLHSQNSSVALALKALHVADWWRRSANASLASTCQFTLNALSRSLWLRPIERTSKGLTIFHMRPLRLLTHVLKSDIHGGWTGDWRDESTCTAVTCHMINVLENVLGSSLLQDLIKRPRSDRALLLIDLRTERDTILTSSSSSHQNLGRSESSKQRGTATTNENNNCSGKDVSFSIFSPKNSESVNSNDKCNNVATTHANALEEERSHNSAAKFNDNAVHQMFTQEALNLFAPVREIIQIVRTISTLFPGRFAGCLIVDPSVRQEFILRLLFESLNISFAPVSNPAASTKHAAGRAPPRGEDSLGASVAIVRSSDGRCREWLEAAGASESGRSLLGL